VIPIDEAERAYERTRGLDNLEERFEETSFNYLGSVSAVSGAVTVGGVPHLAEQLGCLTEAPTVVLLAAFRGSCSPGGDSGRSTALLTGVCRS
jgi:hypothetical protein